MAFIVVQGLWFVKYILRKSLVRLFHGPLCTPMVGLLIHQLQGAAGRAAVQGGHIGHARRGQARWDDLDLRDGPGARLPVHCAVPMGALARLREKSTQARHAFPISDLPDLQATGAASVHDAADDPNDSQVVRAKHDLRVFACVV